jgi:hypothetical protein
LHLTARKPFDRLHQSAGLALLGGAPLAKTAAAQSRSELINGLGWRREIVRRIKVGVHGQVGFDPLEPRDHAGERAHMFSETRHRDPWRHRPVPSACHDQLSTGAKLDRLRRPPRILQFLASAGRALRACGYVMLCDGRAQQVEAHDVIAQIRTKSAGDRSRDFDGGKLDRALSEGIAGER